MSSVTSLLNWVLGTTQPSDSSSSPSNALESRPLRTRQATLEFLNHGHARYTVEKPYYSNVPFSRPGAPSTNVVSEAQRVTVSDVRGHEDALDMDVHGFEAARLERPLGFRAWTDGKAIVREVYPEISRLLKERMGAEVQVVIFDHTLRMSRHSGAAGVGVGGEAGSTPQNFAPPSRVAHVDQTYGATVDQIKLDFGDRADEILRGRFRIINVWKPLKGPVRQHPFVLCDYRTSRHDGIACDLVYPHTATEILVFRHSVAQRWYYLEEQTADEMWYFKIMDSTAEVEGGNVAAFTPHTSFFDEREEVAGEQRESIEFRAYVFG